MRYFFVLVSLVAAAIVAVVLPGAALSDLGDPIELKITYHNVTCTQVGSNLSCSGKISGLGNAAQTVRIDITATRQCTNVGGNEPPGQVKGQSSPLPVRNGSVTFSNVTTQAKACPDKMTPTFIGPATVCVVAVSGTLPGGETSHCEQVPIT